MGDHACPLFLCPLEDPIPVNVPRASPFGSCRIVLEAPPLSSLSCGVMMMELEEEILARIKAAKAWDKDAKLTDFQLKTSENGSVLINLKTRRAQLIYDDESELHDIEQVLGPDSSEPLK
jgi:hypothetical protein